MNDLSVSVIRTIVPVIAGFIITQAVRLGVSLDTAAVTSIVTSVITAAYYGLFRTLEHYRGPLYGKFLGYSKAPQYVNEEISDGH